MNTSIAIDTTLLPQMLDASHDMIFIINLTTQKIVYVNARVYERFGYTIDEMNVLGIENLRRSLSENEDSFSDHVKELLKEGSATDLAYIVPKNGDEFPVEVNAKLVEQDGTLYNIATIRDITSRLETEKKLSELNLNLENLVAQRTLALRKNIALVSSYKDVMDESSIISKSDLHGNITYVNNRFCEITGYSRDEVLGKPHNMVRHPDNDKEIFKELWGTIKSKKS
jgi:PAS domain S-box-containing protein